MYLLDVEFDEAETVGVVGQLFVGQAGEVLAVQWSAAEEEGSSDDVINIAVLISQGAVEGQTFQLVKSSPSWYHNQKRTNRTGGGNG